MRSLVVLLAGALLGAGLGPGLGSPADSVPSSLGLEIGETPNDQPFVGEDLVAQSDPIVLEGGREAWTCHVDFGDGGTGGYWRAKPGYPSAPCAAFHAYSAPGTYTVVMTVTDNVGASRTEQADVTVATRPVAARSAGVEGAAVTLAVPGDVPAQWSVPESAAARCDVAPGPTPSVVVRCHDDGAVRVDYDTGQAATSGAYLVSWTNGAPRPTMRARRTMVATDGSPYYVPVRRVGTGDQVRFDVRAHDPSTPGAKGDELTCHYRHGNGQTSYLAPGRHTSRVRVTDGDGGTGRAKATVVVVRRDVHLDVRDLSRSGPSGTLRAILTPRGLGGRVDLRFANGQRLVATHLDSIQVTRFGAVTLLGRARVNGRGGFRFAAYPDTSSPQGIAFSVIAWRVGKPSRYVVNQVVKTSDFRVRLHAPPVR